MCADRASGGRRSARSDPARGDARGSRRIPPLPTVATDPLTGTAAEVRTVQPYQARKTYVCPGCNHEVRPGTGHLVVVPLGDAASRRHWHRACWERRETRRAGG